MVAVRASAPVAVSKGPETSNVVTTQRTRRSDAVRNRAGLLAAAEEAFAGLGLGAPVEEIARQAGVGIGTLYRHFPTKEALADAVLARVHEQLTEHLRHAFDLRSSRDALFEFCRSLSEFQSRHRALAEVMAHDHPTDTYDVGRDQLYRQARKLVRRAQADGVVRSDIGTADVVILIACTWQSALIDVRDRRMRDRYITLIIDGLQPANPSPLPGPIPGPAALRRRGSRPRTDAAATRHT